MAGAIARSTVQIHLNRRCNLACRHCYSHPGPDQRAELAPAALAVFLADAAREGYRVAAFSGGEPFLYHAFARALTTARDKGLITIAVTNATTLRGGEAALGLLDFLAVSVDGPEPIHNAMRQSTTAYARMLRGLDVVRSAGLAFGIAHTLTRETLPHLTWLAEFAHDSGAQALQLHPLSIVGAADGALAPLDGETLARAYLAALALRREFGATLSISVELFNRETIRHDPDLVMPPAKTSGVQPRLADVLNPLVLMTNGDLSPICHAMGPRYRLGNIADAPLATLADRFLETGLEPLRALCEQQRHALLGDASGWPYVNWYEMLERRSCETS